MKTLRPQAQPTNLSAEVETELPRPTPLPNLGNNFADDELVGVDRGRRMSSCDDALQEGIKKMRRVEEVYHETQEILDALEVTPAAPKAIPAAPKAIPAAEAQPRAGFRQRNDTKREILMDRLMLLSEDMLKKKNIPYDGSR